MSTEEQKNFESNNGDQQKSGVSRRNFLTGTACLSAAAAVSLSPLLSAEEVPSGDDFIQKHYKELSANLPTFSIWVAVSAAVNVSMPVWKKTTSRVVHRNSISGS